MEGYQILEQRVLNENDYYQDENKKEGYENPLQTTSNMFDADTSYDIGWATDITKKKDNRLEYPSTDVFNIKIGDIVLMRRGDSDIQMEKTLNKTYFNVVPPILNGLTYKPDAFDYLNDFKIFGVSPKTIQYKRIKELMDSNNGFSDNQNRDKEKYFNSMVMFCDPTVRNGPHTVYPHETLYLFPYSLVKWGKKIDVKLNKDVDDGKITLKEKAEKKKSLLIKKSSEKPVTLDIVPEREFLPELKKYFFMNVDMADEAKSDEILGDKNNQVHSKTKQTALSFFVGIQRFNEKLLLQSNKNLGFSFSDLVFGNVGGSNILDKTGGKAALNNKGQADILNEDISDMLFTSVLNFKKIFDDAKIGKSLNYALKGEEMRILFNTSGSN